MASQIEHQITIIHIFSNVSRSKCNQTMKFGQLRGYNRRNIFLKTHTQNGAEKLVPDPFIKIKIEHICGSRV